MPDSSRHGYITFGWIATICYLLLFAAIQNSQNSSINQSSYYQQKCAEQYPDSPFAARYGVSGFPKPEAEQGNKELADVSDWCDLAAQQSMAEDTASMRLVAWFGFFSGIAGIWLLIWTLFENRKVSEAAIEANRIAKLEQRPWVTIKRDIDCVASVLRLNANSLDYVNLIVDWACTVKNVGKTPAFGVRVSSRLFTPTNDTSPTEGFTEFLHSIEGRANTDNAVFPDETGHYKRFTNAKSLDIMNEEHQRFYLFIAVSYRSQESELFGIEARITEITFDSRKTMPSPAKLLEFSEHRVTR